MEARKMFPDDRLNNCWMPKVTILFNLKKGYDSKTDYERGRYLKDDPNLNNQYSQVVRKTHI